MINTLTAFVFPGQGSQSVGMLKELADAYPLIQETYQEASDILNYDCWKLIQEGPEEELNQTEKTQPAILIGSVAVWRVWQQTKAMQPTLMAGHSLGEYSALVCADAIEFKTAVKLVAARGRFMQEAVPLGQGGMAAIVGLENAVVEKLCQQAAQGEIITPANFNAHGQVVVAGQINAVKRLVELALNSDARLAKLLPMSVPSHCDLMRPAAKRLAELLENTIIKSPKIPVIQNADVRSETDPDKIRAALVKQLYSPVRWVETIEYFAKHGVKQIFECGPGKVLAGLNKRIVSDIPTLSLTTKEQLEQI
jgi:[acyl-carrier-protein] S-malonyltransferase